MKWNFNDVFDKLFSRDEVVKKFLWLPTGINGEWRWLETATYERSRWSGSGWGWFWTKMRWMD